jgi:C-terminal processing protease CtpA/Prc
MVGYLMSAFTKPNATIYDVIHYRAGTESERPAQLYPHPRLDIPLYVLTSGRTASAAEAMAYELQAAGRAVVVGEVSSGAANPGGEFPAGEGFNVFISIGTPVNPLTRGNWEGKGVDPDVHVPADAALHRAQVLALEEVLARQGSAGETLDAR